LASKHILNDNVDGDDDGLNGGHVVVNVKIQFYRTDYTLKSLLQPYPNYVLRDISRIGTHNAKQQETWCRDRLNVEMRVKRKKGASEC
jgi:hypothetical protein